MSQMNPDRRRFLGFAAASVATTAVAVPAVQQLGLSSANGVEALLEQFFHRPDSARLIGALYLRAHPHEQHAQVLAESLLPKDHTPIDIEVFGMHLRQQVRDDFTHANTVDVAGLILSRQEARLCALATLVV